MINVGPASVQTSVHTSIIDIILDGRLSQDNILSRPVGFFFRWYWYLLLVEGLVGPSCDAVWPVAECPRAGFLTKSNAQAIITALCLRQNMFATLSFNDDRGHVRSLIPHIRLWLVVRPTSVGPMINRTCHLSLLALRVESEKGIYTLAQSVYRTVLSITSVWPPSPENSLGCAKPPHWDRCKLSPGSRLISSSLQQTEISCITDHAHIFSLSVALARNLNTFLSNITILPTRSLKKPRTPCSRQRASVLGLSTLTKDSCTPAVNQTLGKVSGYGGLRIPSYSLSLSLSLSLPSIRIVLSLSGISIFSTEGLRPDWLASLRRLGRYDPSFGLEVTVLGSRELTNYLLNGEDRRRDL
ncbi:hypothetical protein BDY19DRAFT_1047876 [Irpex rosettiformis]|uniref:Uncharacterized protein n=1 Tax=Irpex rosettiformis TaxID=378272 RepID=A0ACB8U548_9APHY|nr:hypothetical protein BDY19DRAFT_1047876 [Irpex rosettiformis]